MHVSCEYSSCCYYIPCDGVAIQVVASDLNPKAAQQTVDQLLESSAGQPFHHLHAQVNVSKRYQVEELFKKVLATFQIPPSVIVNCAGITRDKQISAMTEELFDEVMDVNVKGTFVADSGKELDLEPS